MRSADLWRGGKGRRWGDYTPVIVSTMKIEKPKVIAESAMFMEDTRIGAIVVRKKYRRRDN